MKMKVLTLWMLGVLVAAPTVVAQEGPLFALLWTQPDRTTFEHMTPMVRTGQPGWLNELRSAPEGRRAVVVTGPHNSMWIHPDDRCQAVDGSLAHLSSEPVKSGTFYKNSTGRDGKPSGYSCPWSWVWADDYKSGIQSRIDEIVQAGLSVDFVIFDVESKMDWLKINKDWERAIVADPRWPQAKVALDSLKKLGTGDPTATFSWSGGTEDGLAWNAYMWEQQAKALNRGVFDVYKAQWPNVKGSNYEHHARRPGDTTVETYGWEFYQTAVTGTHASDYHYGWLIQVEDVDLGMRTFGNTSDWLTFVFEQRKARSSIRAGFPIQPWICYSGNRNIDWRVSPGAPASHKPNPFWEENIRHLLMLEADPILYWNSRSYSNTDHSTDELDGFVDRLIGEVNDLIGTASPRYTITSENVSWFGERANDAGLRSRLPSGEGVVATGLRHGSQVTYRIAIERVSNNPDQWPAVDVRVLRDGRDTGQRVRIPAGQTGAYFTTAFLERSTYSFDFEPAPVPNVLPSLDLTDGTWVRGADSFSATTAVSCPVDGAPVISLYDKSFVSATGPKVQLIPGQIYTFSAYLRGRSDSGRGGVRILDETGNTLVSQVPYNREPHGWGRYSVTFRATTAAVVPVVTGYRQYACAPALHLGGMPGRVVPGVVALPEVAEQRMRLQPGWNMVALNVDPGPVAPDSLLNVHDAVALVRDVNGATLSTRFDINEIAAWDARTAYRVLVDEPTEIVLKGRPLRMQNVELQAGWNLVPFVHDKPLNLVDVAAAYPGLILRAEDDRGNVYEPGMENVTLASFEPGRAYRIYAARAALLSFSP